MLRRPVAKKLDRVWKWNHRGIDYLGLLSHGEWREPREVAAAIGVTDRRRINIMMHGLAGLAAAGLVERRTVPRTEGKYKKRQERQPWRLEYRISKIGRAHVEGRTMRRPGRAAG